MLNIPYLYLLYLTSMLYDVDFDATRKGLQDAEDRGLILRLLQDYWPKMA